MEIDSTKAGIRSQDIQTSVQDVDLGALSAETKNIRLVGMAERLAIHIRGIDVITDEKKVEYIASQFGIDALVLPSVFGVLEDLGWIRIKKDGKKIKRIEESVPYFSDLYSIAGAYLKDLSTTEVEHATLEITDRLALSPATEIEIIKNYGLDKTTFGMVKDIGLSGGFIDSYEIKDTKERVLYSPIYWVENPKKLEIVYSLLRDFGAENVASALKKISNYQGLPLADSLFKTNKAAIDSDSRIFCEAVKRGMILAPQVASFNGIKAFAFTPQIGIALEEKIIMEKAMCVLSCVRYGENFGTITKIKYPRAILDRLLNSPYRIGSHSEIKQQYALLVGRGMGKVYPDSVNKSKYYFELNPSKENLKAINLSIDLLEVGEAITNKGVKQSAKDFLFYPGSYNDSMRTIPRIKKSPNLSLSTQEEIQDTLNNIVDAVRQGA